MKSKTKQKQAIIDLMEHDKEAGLYDIDFKHNTHMTDKVKEAIYCFEQSTPEKYEEDHHKAARYESCIFELFREMTDEELNNYREQLVKLGYVDRSEYSRSENGLITQKTFTKDKK